MSSGPTGAASHVRKFAFSAPTEGIAADESTRLEIFIPELLRASYSSYTWPCAPVLATFLWTQRTALRGIRVLELGAGTALPGILAAKCGAHVTLTESFTLPESLRHLTRVCEANGLTVGRDIRVLGLTWGAYLGETLDIIGDDLDLVIASDCFYDPTVFEDVIATVASLLEARDTKFVCSYQERSSDWCIEPLLNKWGLKCRAVDLKSLGERHGVNFEDCMGDHTVHVLEITAA